jgi:autotransporter-associated beta strand protein
MAGGSICFGYQNHGGTAILNLNGGSLQLKAISHGVSGCTVNSTVNFNGGKLIANQAHTSFVVASNVYVYAKGAAFDCGGYAVTLTQPLVAPFGQGVVGLPWGGTLTGYLGAPYVSLSGGSGTGATAVALFDYASGSVTGVLTTCAGVGYQPGDTVSVKLMGGGVADVALGTATLGATTGGGLTKLGSGTLTLSGVSTYSGATIVSNGTLYVISTNLLASTEWMIAAGATNKFGSGVSLVGKSLTVDAAGTTSGLLYVTGDLKLGGALTVQNLTDPRKIAQCTGTVSGQFDSIATGEAVTYVVNGNEVWVKKSRGTLVRVL